MAKRKKKPKTVVVDKYEPDWNTPCENCGQYPTVTLMQNGKAVNHIELCGACLWGESDCLDPDNW